MARDVIMTDMRTSMSYLSKAEPIILDLLRGGYMMTVEGSDDEICRMLDTSCGIDYFHIYEERHNLTWGVASRFQKIKQGQVPWNTFTVRKSRDNGHKTEYEKRRYAIDHGGIYPYLTLQGYYNESGDILSIGIAKTEDVMRCVDEKIGYSNHTGWDKCGQASFWVIEWDLMKQAGYNVAVYEAETQTQESLPVENDIADPFFDFDEFLKRLA